MIFYLFDRTFALASVLLSQVDSLTLWGTFMVMGYLVWRLYRFHLWPLLHSSDPKEPPYWIPWHINSLTTNFSQRTFAGSSRSPFLLTFLGRQTCIVASEKDALVINDNGSAFSRDPGIKYMASAIGVTADGIRKLFRLPPGAEHSAKSPAHRCISIIKHEMSPGSGDNLQSKILRQINDVVHWESISPKAVREDGSDSRTVSLSRWVRDTFVLGSAKAMFGDSLLKVDPRFTESFFSFDDQSWKLLYGMPGQALDPAFKAIRNVQDTFRKFLELPVNERSDTSDMIRKMQASIKEGGVSDSDVATFMSMVYWGANTNAWKACFWYLAFIIQDQVLFTEIRSEIMPVVQKSQSKTPNEFADELKRCQKFAAVFWETLRITSSSGSPRHALRDFTLRDTRIPKGTNMVITYHEMLMCEEEFGSDASRFRWNRFHDNPALLKSPNFQPFGGGSGLCPGRFIAQAEIMTFAALTLCRFDIEMVHPKSGIPQIDDKTPSMGAMYAVGREDVRVKIRRAACEARLNDVIGWFSR